MRKHDIITIILFVVSFTVLGLYIFCCSGEDILNSLNSTFISAFAGIVVALPSLIVILLVSYREMSDEVYDDICKLKDVIQSFKREVAYSVDITPNNKDTVCNFDVKIMSFKGQVSKANSVTYTLPINVVNLLDGYRIKFNRLYNRGFFERRSKVKALTHKMDTVITEICDNIQVSSNEDMVFTDENNSLAELYDLVMKTLE